MAEDTRLQRLLAAIRRRDLLAQLAGRWWRAVVALGIACVLALSAWRLGGLRPELPWPWLVGAVPLVALLWSLWRLRPLGPAAAARLCDRHSASDDLFLTAYQLRPDTVSPYAELVHERAQTTATQLRPGQVRPWRPAPRWLIALPLVAAGLAGTQWLPRGDPFGLLIEERAVAARQARLQASDEATERRLADLTEQRTELDDEHSPTVAAELAALERELDQAQPDSPERNATRLQDAQQRLGALFRQAQAQRLKQRLDDQAAQRFGGAQAHQQALDALRRGDASVLRSELDRLRQQLDQLSGSDGAQAPEQRRLLKRLQRDLDGLRQAAREAGAQALAEDLERAREQLGLASQSGVGEEALRALERSLQAARLDGERLAQMQRDLQQLEQALAAAQQAKQLNQQGKLGNQACQQCKGKGLAAYRELYAQLLQQGGQGQGQGEGTGGQGRGKGGTVPEDDSVASDYQTERSDSALLPGKTLMEWRSKGIGERGDVQRIARRQIEQVRQDLAEAIAHEDVPPAYHDSIKAYFDDLPTAITREPGSPAEQSTPAGQAVDDSIP